MNNSMNATVDDAQTACKLIYLTWNFTYISLCPVFVLVLCLGFRRWKQRSHSASDVFTFNVAAAEMVGVAGAFLSMLDFFLSKNGNFSDTGNRLLVTATVGQTLFNNLICIERYLAVVHPIAYMRLSKKGKLIRDACVIGVWLICFGVTVIYHYLKLLFMVFCVIVMGVASMFIIAFLSASVLCVLVRPGPGERGGDRRRVDQSKRRAFYAMTLITVAIMLKFVTLFISYFTYALRGFEGPFCVLAVSFEWLKLPSVLVTPVLFLHQQVTQNIKP